jgi:hypothetical protein
MRLANLLSPDSVVAWANETVRILESTIDVIERTKQTKGTIARVSSFLKTNLPNATQPGEIIYVSNETGGAVLAFSDGTNWRRVTDRAVVA